MTAQHQALALVPVRSTRGAASALVIARFVARDRAPERA